MTHSVSACHLLEVEKQSPAHQLSDGSVEWIHRASNFVVAISRVKPGTRLVRTQDAQSDEYMVLLPEGVTVTVAAGADTVQSDGDSLTIVPPGSSEVVARSDGWVYRVFSHLASDLVGAASNAVLYAEAAPNVAALESWPMPVGGYRLRHYPLASYVRQDTVMRLFRTRHLMLNIFLPSKAPRDVRKMTPHSHSDFEQGSLALNGEFIHHVRYPWMPDMTAWREDGHLHVGSPSLIVMPPPVVHTSQSIGASGMRLVDIFAPPRDDFSLKPGLVCNADEYPLPERLKNAAPAGEVA